MLSSCFTLANVCKALPTLQRPNWLVKPTPTSSACWLPPCFAALSGFRPNRIYLAPVMADEVERLINLFAFIGSEFQNVNYRDPETLERYIAPEVIDTWERVVVASRELFPKLEQQFRKNLRPGEG